MKRLAIPPCPKCWAPMRLDMCHDGFTCEAPHGSLGPMFLSMEGWAWPHSASGTLFTNRDGSLSWVDDELRSHPCERVELG